MTHYNKITLENIKNFFENYSIKISTEISDSEVFFGLSSLKNAKENDISLDNLFSNKGLLSKSIKEYEYRKNQYDFAVDCAKNTQESSVLIAEADTGIGKTFAYIIATLLNTKKNKILISSSTHNLQNQLFYKDIPIIAKILNINIKATIAKGMNNYLCKNRINKTWL